MHQQKRKWGMKLIRLQSWNYTLYFLYDLNGFFDFFNIIFHKLFYQLTLRMYKNKSSEYDTYSALKQMCIFHRFLDHFANSNNSGNSSPNEKNKFVRSSNTGRGEHVVTSPAASESIVWPWHSWNISLSLKSFWIVWNQVPAHQCLF